MQVRDLIEELKRFDPYSEVFIGEYHYEKKIGGGRGVKFLTKESLDRIDVKAGEPVLVHE